jgi:hypothetical protein
MVDKSFDNGEDGKLKRLASSRREFEYQTRVTAVRGISEA